MSGNFYSCTRVYDLKRYDSLVRQHNISEHAYSRKKRNDFVFSIKQKPVACFLVDRGHINGPELHFITDHGCIIIFNEHTGRFVTTLIARPNQIMRYFRETHTDTVYMDTILSCCHEYVVKGLNYL